MKKRKNSELTIEFKRAAVALMAPGVKVSALARELGVCRQRLYEWREALRLGDDQLRRPGRPKRSVEPPAQADDLELIEGIGPKIAGVLTAAGIVTFADLAAAETSRLTEILQQEPNLRLADPSTWSEQAALAAAGKWDEFKVLTEQLKGGRRA